MHGRYTKYRYYHTDMIYASYTIIMLDVVFNVDIHTTHDLPIKHSINTVIMIQVYNIIAMYTQILW